MTTLFEIEAAVDALPVPQQMVLLRHLESRLRGCEAGGARLVDEDGVAVLVAPSGAPAMTPDVVRAALADFP